MGTSSASSSFTTLAATQAKSRNALRSGKCQSKRPMATYPFWQIWKNLGEKDFPNKSFANFCATDKAPRSGTPNPANGHRPMAKIDHLRLGTDLPPRSARISASVYQSRGKGKDRRHATFRRFDAPNIDHRLVFWTWGSAARSPKAGLSLRWFIFIALATIHAAAVLVAPEALAPALAGTVYLPLLPLKTLGMPVIGAAESGGWSSPSLLGWAAVILLWSSIWWAAAVLLARLLAGRTHKV